MELTHRERAAGWRCDPEDDLTPRMTRQRRPVVCSSTRPPRVARSGRWAPSVSVTRYVRKYLKPRRYTVPQVRSVARVAVEPVRIDTVAACDLSLSTRDEVRNGTRHSYGAVSARAGRDRTLEQTRPRGERRQLPGNGELYALFVG
jgi:hypothetical protein